MEEANIPSLSSGAIGSRFVSQDDLESAKSRREEQWKAAYARLGQEPPKQAEEPYDGRSLAEKLAANKIAKQEEYEEKTKLANQFRALEEDEIMFLDSVREKEMEAERLRKELEGEELKGFKEAVAARSVAPPPIITPAKPTAPPAPKAAASAPKKDHKKAFKGVMVKKKSKAPIANSGEAKKPEKTPKAKEGLDDKKRTLEVDTTSPVEPNAKRSRVMEA